VPLRYHILGREIVPLVTPNGPQLCLLSVISGHFAPFDQCPLYPRKRTFTGLIGMSALCQSRTCLDAGAIASCRVSALQQSIPPQSGGSDPGKVIPS
jgi:hypothetical protein